MNNTHDTEVSDHVSPQMELPPILTLEETRERYWGEWLLIDLTELDENMNVKKGRVPFYPKDQERRAL